MNNQPVAVLDSGIGGLPYLSWIQEHLPQENLIYFADRKNFPYGEKSPEEVRDAVIEGVQSLVDRYNPKMLVVACNTASTLALDQLRDTFSFPIVGVVPAVKTAASRTKNGKICVLATKRTAEGEYLKGLIRDFCDGKMTVCLAASDIVSHVEDDYLNPDLGERDRILSNWAQEIRAQQFDTVVLACTHFLHVTTDMERHLGPGIEIIDSRDGVGRQAQKVLAEKGLLADRKNASDRFLFSASREWSDEKLQVFEEKYRVFASRFFLEYGGAVVL